MFIYLVNSNVSFLFQMQILQEGVLRQFDADETPENPFRRKAVPVQAVLAQVQPERQSEQAYEGPRRISDVTQHAVADYRRNTAAVLSDTSYPAWIELTTKSVDLNYISHQRLIYGRSKNRR